MDFYYSKRLYETPGCLIGESVYVFEYIPDAPCREYLPTLGEKWPHSRGNVGKYSIHGAFGYGIFGGVSTEFRLCHFFLVSFWQGESSPGFVDEKFTFGAAGPPGFDALPVEDPLKGFGSGTKKKTHTHAFFGCFWFCLR